MGHRHRPKSLTLALLLLAVASSAHPLRAEPPRQLRITVVEGGSCVVEGTAIPCADLLSHLREVVKLPAGSLVRVRVDDTATTATDEVTMKVFELLLHSEYKTPIGIVDVSKLPNE
jgi:hypothetical protein